MTEALGSAAPVLDYEALVEEYNASLFAVLRHHRSAGYLDTWVPDDDPVRSILNMVEAAEIAGHAELAVRIGSETLSHVDLAALTAMLGTLGRVRIGDDGVGTVIRVAAIGGRATDEAVDAGGDWFTGVADAYRNAVVAAAGTIAFEGALDAVSGGSAVSAEHDGVRLALGVDAGHVIRRATHAGTANRIDRAVMDRLCAILIDLPVQEAHDHAAIRLEAALRDPTAGRVLPGIVHPERADPMFVRPAQLIRDAVARYAAAAGVRFGSNTFARRPTPAWLALGAEGRLARLDAFLEDRIGELGLAPGQAEIVAIDHTIRVTAGFRDDVPVAAKPPFLMRLERALHEIEPALQVFSIELKDANKIRRL